MGISVECTVVDRFDKSLCCLNLHWRKGCLHLIRTALFLVAICKRSREGATQLGEGGLTLQHCKQY